MSSLKNNYVFQLTGTLLTSGDTVTISTDLELNQTVSFTNARIVFRNRNATIIERAVGSASGGTLTLSKRGLEQGDTEVENASLKKEWREGTRVYVTILASQLVDRQEDNTFGGTQTFNNVIINNQLTIPRFADDTARDTAIPTPTAGMVVQTNNVYQGYNSSTAQWEDFDIGTPPPSASETVQGLVELATKAEQGSQTENGSSGPLVVQAQNTVKEYYLYTPAFLTGGTNAESDFSVWAAVTDGSFRISIDGTAYNIDAIDFTGDTDMDDVAATIQTALRAATSGEETVVRSTDKFIITSGSDRSNSAITVTTTSTGTVGTNISGVGASDWMDCDTGNGTVTDAVLTPSLHEALAVLLKNTGKIDSTLIDNEAVLAEGVEALVDKDTYRLGEDADAGDSVFVEDMIIFDNADQEQNVGDVSGNTRVSIPAIGSGTAGSTLNLSLRKESAPSVDFGVRIETDNAGEPSGTLVDSNATGTVTAASLTTSLADTAVSLAGSVTIEAGTKVHIVLFQGTYDSETVNGTNYYVIGYDAKNTTTRPLNTYNGSIYGTPDNDIFAYVDSDLFENELLSLTDATYSYKLPTDVPRILTETKTTGENAIATTIGFNDNFTGLTPLTTYYLSDTPGAISSTSGTNEYAIGLSITSTILDVDNKENIITVEGGGDYQSASAPTSRNTSSTSYVKLKEIRVGKDGNYQTKFTLVSGNNNNSQARVYKNGIAVGTARNVANTTPVTFTENLDFVRGDLYQIYAKVTDATSAIITDVELNYNVQKFNEYDSEVVID